MGRLVQSKKAKRAHTQQARDLCGQMSQANLMRTTKAPVTWKMSRRNPQCPMRPVSRAACRAGALKAIALQLPRLSLSQGKMFAREVWLLFIWGRERHQNYPRRCSSIRCHQSSTSFRRMDRNHWQAHKHKQWYGQARRRQTCRGTKCRLT